MLVERKKGRGHLTKPLHALQESVLTQSQKWYQMRPCAVGVAALQMEHGEAEAAAGLRVWHWRINMTISSSAALFFWVGFILVNVDSLALRKSRSVSLQIIWICRDGVLESPRRLTGDNRQKGHAGGSSRTRRQQALHLPGPPPV